MCHICQKGKHKQAKLIKMFGYLQNTLSRIFFEFSSTSRGVQIVYGILVLGEKGSLLTSTLMVLSTLSRVAPRPCSRYCWRWDVSSSALVEHTWCTSMSSSPASRLLTLFMSLGKHKKHISAGEARTILTG